MIILLKVIMQIKYQTSLNKKFRLQKPAVI